MTGHPTSEERYAADAARPRDRYAQCHGDCTVDCGACKGKGRPAETPEQMAERYGLPVELLNARVTFSPEPPAETQQEPRMVSLADAMGVPTNDELAERAKSLDAHTVVRNWLARHPMPQTQVTDDRNRWLDWAARNFLADPEVAIHVTARPSADTETLRARVERVALGLGQLAGVLDGDDEDHDQAAADLLRSVQADLRAALDGAR